jgi:hypothetical protein
VTAFIALPPPPCLTAMPTETIPSSPATEAGAPQGLMLGPAWPGTASATRRPTSDAALLPTIGGDDMATPATLGRHPAWPLLLEGLATLEVSWPAAFARICNAVALYLDLPAGPPRRRCP